MVRAVLAAVLALCLAAPCRAQTKTGYAVNPTDLLGPNASYGQDYQEMNTRITQVHVVRNIPFVQMTPAQRAARLGEYYSFAKGGQVKTLGGSVINDFSTGTMAKDVGVALMTSVLTRMSQGKTLEESVDLTWKYMCNTQFFVGQMFGGMVGAMVGAMIPVPALGGLVGQMVSGIPMMAGAMLGGTVGYDLVDGIKKGDLDFARLIKSIDYVNLAFQAVGATIGMTLGACLPVPGLGAVIGGAVGGNLGMKALQLLRERLAPAAESVERASGTTEPVVAVYAAPAAPTSITADVAALRTARDAAYRAFLGSQAGGDPTLQAQALQAYRAAEAALAAAAPAAVAR